MGKKDWFLHLVADYGVGDPAFGEVVHKIRTLDSLVEVYPTSVPPFSTLATGFWIAQYALQNPSPSLSVFSNTAPRTLIGKRHGNEGEVFLFATLRNGVPVFAVHAGYAFSFIKEDIVSLHEVRVPNKGSQFRSRDYFPEAVIGILHGEKTYVGQNYEIGAIPDIPPKRIAFVDGYGNIKTTVRTSDQHIPFGFSLKVSIGRKVKQARVVHGIFEVEKGQLAFAPGSSGRDDRFWEISLRGGSAWEFFGKPPIESDIAYKEMKG
ncbi:MAG TPA: hypothetical protein VJ179_01975 [Patescibacteria group bacterium]|nr:hypothetical protein [Patescibacteria group bacterium]